MTVTEATDQAAWDAFLTNQQWSPFLQSWTMGEVYREIGQEAVRIEMRERDQLIGICFGNVVPAKRGRHLSVPYGPVLDSAMLSTPEKLSSTFTEILHALERVAREHRCSFIRLSPFWPLTAGSVTAKLSESIERDGRLQGRVILPSPLHLLAEHIWYMDLQGKAEDQLLMDMRKTTRNLIRRAERDDVTIRASTEANRDIEHFIRLHDETRKRHGFTPYTNTFFRAQVKHFSAANQCTLYLAECQGSVIATSIHMHAFGETSYHHGASADSFRKIPASYLLQWTAMKDAMKRGDRIYNFWGIAPQETGFGAGGQIPNKSLEPNPNDLRATSYPSDRVIRADKLQASRHPFAGVTLFKTGFGGQLLNLAHCMDIPLSGRYHLTRTFEQFRKWRRGF